MEGRREGRGPAVPRRQPPLLPHTQAYLLTGSGRSGVPREKMHMVFAPSVYLSRRGPSRRDVAVMDLAAARCQPPSLPHTEACLLTGSGRSGVPREKMHTVSAPSIYLSQHGPSRRDVAVMDLAAAPLTSSTRSGASSL